MKLPQWSVVIDAAPKCKHKWPNWPYPVPPAKCSRCGALLLYKPEPKAIELHNSRAPNILYGGAAGGMKSHTLRWHGILICMTVPGAQVLLLRRVYKELHKTHLLKLMVEVPEQLAHWNKSDGILEFPNRSMLHFGHCQHENDFTKHLSTEWDTELVDESGEFTEYMLRLLPSRLRTTKPNLRPQYVLGSNPGGEGHEYNFSRFVEKSVSVDDDPSYDPRDYHFIKADWNDNPYIDREEYYHKRILPLPEWERRRFSGDWSIAPDRMFPTWARATHVYDVWTPENEAGVLYKPHWPLYRSLDWGYAAPTSVGWWLIDEDANPYRVKELYVAELDPEEQVPLIREIDEWLANTRLAHANELGIPWIGPTEPPRYTVADPAIWDQAPRWVKGPGPPLAERYRQAGLTDLRPGTNQRVPGWQMVRDYLNPKTVPLLRVEAGCKNFIKQCSLVRRDPRFEEDLDKEQEDHAIDDARYFLMSRPRPAFEPVEKLEAKHEPGSPGWHEARYLQKINERAKKKRRWIYTEAGPVRIR